MAKRRVYLDLGSREYNSTPDWFVNNYPKGDTFHIKAFDVRCNFATTYVGKPNAEFRCAAIWNEERNLSFTNPTMAYAIPNGAKFAAAHRILTGGSWIVPAINFAKYLTENYVLDDFVVVKMDIEGAEFRVIPHLIETKAIDLIDEIFVECHYVGGGMVFSTSTKWTDCFQLFSNLRNVGGYSHEWF